MNRKLALAAASALFLGLGGCATTYRAEVSRFQTMPPPAGQSFVVLPADPRDQGSVEFAHYADLVRWHMVGLGYAEASAPQYATLIVCFAYGVDDGSQPAVFWASSPYSYYRSWPFNRGWGAYPYPGGAYAHYGWDVDVVHSSRLDLAIHRVADGRSVFEGRALAHSSDHAPTELVPNLIDAMFTRFPGNSGETIEVDVPRPADRPPPGAAPVHSDGAHAGQL